MRSSVVEELGELVYREPALVPGALTPLSNSRVLIISLTLSIIGFIPFLVFLFVLRTESLDGAIDLVFLLFTVFVIGAVLAACIYLRYLLYSATPIKVYENGLLMPSSILERTISGPKALPADTISIIYPSVEIEEDLRQYIGFIVVMNDGKRHTSSRKASEEVSRIMQLVKQRWPHKYNEFGEIESLSLKQRRRLQKHTSIWLKRTGDALFALFFVLTSLLVIMGALNELAITKFQIDYIVALMIADSASISFGSYLLHLFHRTKGFELRLRIYEAAKRGSSVVGEE